MNTVVIAGKGSTGIELFASQSRNSMAVFLLLSFAERLGMEVTSGG